MTREPSLQRCSLKVSQKAKPVLGSLSPLGWDRAEVRACVKKIHGLVPALLRWFSTNARDLPWRRTGDPYAIWVSEIMLQQTQVKTVTPYWERWMRVLPAIQSVAEVNLARLHKLWEGLGYYTRVRNLQKAAQQIVARHNGKFPENFDDILALPGVGRYTAGAIASIAFNQPRPILDGNVIRVLTRIFGIAGDPHEKKTNAKLWEFAEQLVEAASTHKTSATIKNRPKPLPPPGQRAGVRMSVKHTDRNACSHLNQSLMELGALVCTPRSPDCTACPVSRHCVAFRQNRQGELPNLAKRKTAVPRRFIAFVVERNGRFLVRQRPNGVVNAHLWEFPNVEAGARFCQPQHAATSAFGCNLAALQRLCIIQHSITHYRITLEAWRVKLARPRAKISGRWLTLAKLRELAFTSAHKKILAQLESLAE